MTDAFSNVLERAICIVEEESRALREKRTARLAEMHAQKSLILFELGRLAAEGSGVGAAAPTRIEALRGKLVENQSILRLNIDALQEVIETLQDLRQVEESDGTYSAQAIIGSRRK